MPPRKQHNRGSFIDPRLVESMLADGHSMGQIAWHLNVDRKTLLNRSGRDPDLREAIRIGKERHKHFAKLRRLPRQGNTADELETLLTCLLRDVRSLRKLAA